MKSNAIAAMTIRTIRKKGSGILHYDCLQDVGNIFQSICRVFELFVNRLPADEVVKPVRLLDQGGNSGSGQSVSLIFKAVDLHSMLSNSWQRLFVTEERNGEVYLHRALGDDPRQLHRDLGGFVDLVERERVSRR